VSSIVQDSRGFIWFCTNEGLSRFDGYSFTSFGRQDGLIGPGVFDLLEARDGTIWVATEGGLAKMEPSGRPPASIFRIFTPPGPSAGIIRTLAETRDGSIWAGTFGGLFRFDPASEKFDSVDFGRPDARDRQLQVNDLLEDAQGDLWIATRYLGLIRRHSDGRLDHFFSNVAPPAGNIRALAPDGAGGLWAGGFDGLVHVIRGKEGNGVIAASRYTRADGLPDDQVYALQLTHDGRLAVATSSGAAILSPANASPAKIVSMTPKQGLGIIKAVSLAQDGSGNLWIGSDGSGAWKLARDGFTTFTESDGLPGPMVVSLLRDRGGEIYASTRTRRRQWALTRLGDPPLRTTTIKLPARINYLGWGIGQLALQDRLGDWWVPTGLGLVRFSGVDSAERLASASPRAIYMAKDGLATVDILHLFEDSRSDIWVSAEGATRFDRGTGRFSSIAASSSVFGEDAAGNVWIGTGDGSLQRFRDGHLDSFDARDGVPAGGIEAIFLDSRSRLWIGTSDAGAARVDEPAAAKPVFTSFGAAQGLSSLHVNCITEDLFGRIYLGTGHGVEVVEPDTGRLRHFTRDDGLAGNDILVAQRDATGAVWFGTQEGVSRLSPRAPDPRGPPTIFISDVSLSGVRQPVNLLGETALTGLALSPDQRQIEIGFVGLDFSAGGRLRYQYRLEGADADWSAPSEHRSVNYARLSAGAYKFAVRALDSDGQSSLVPATVSFSIMKPVWQRAWFVSLMAAALAGLIYALYRYRLSQALGLERVRMHIATDLHDDIGASLSQIAILNEVALRRLRGSDGDPAGLLATAAQSAREVVDAMSDVVWAVDPKHDRLDDLVLRMRRFAEDLCAARGIELSFSAPEDGARRLDAQVRRQIHLLFKESLNNAVKHSGCRRIQAELRMASHALTLRVTDDGVGFDSSAASDGHGLASMRRRCEALGGTLRIRSAPGDGTEVRISIPD
jgi:signal transduction histidine kinase/ligand-binding sensor domain-containing protein